MANHTLPTTTDTYANVLTYLHARIDDASKKYNSSLTYTNPPTGVCRWNSTSFTWESNTGTPATPIWTAWSALYNININGTVGATTPSTGAFTTLSTTGVAALAANSTMGGAVIANISAVQILTNKTLTSPTITGMLATASAFNGTIGSTTASTGLFTSIGATGGISNTAPINTNSTISLIGSGAYSSILTLNAAGGGSGFITSGTAVSLYLNAPTGLSVYQSINNVAVTTVSSSGLAVIGGLSTTGQIASTGGISALSLSSVTNTAVTALFTRPNKSYKFSLDINNNGGTDFTLYDNTRSAIGWMLDGAGNLGLGVTPSTWGAAWKVVEAPGNAMLVGNSAVLASNSYNDGIWKYKATLESALYWVTSGNHYWYTAPIGTADTAISYAQVMTLNISGNLGLGVAPSAWVGLKVLEFGGGNFYGSNGATGLWSGSNSYFNGTNWIYKTTAASSLYTQQSGTHKWNIAGSGTAGTIISYNPVMTIDNSGTVVIGGSLSTAATAILDIQSTTKGLKFPSMTTAQKNAIANTAGLVVYDATLNKLSANNGTFWGSVGGGATGAGSDDIFYENGQTVTTSYTLTTNKNAMSAGPITINNGVTVTVPNGATWSVI